MAFCLVRSETYSRKRIPGVFPASRKTLTPGSRLKERGQRFYNPSMGRWLSRDPIEEDGGPNLYVVCANSLVSTTDSLGMLPYECQSEWLAERDPFWGTHGSWPTSGKSSTCNASISHWASTYRWFGPEALCNAGTYLRIKAKSDCCRKYQVSCWFWYTASVSTLSPTSSLSRPSGINLPVTLLAQSLSWVALPTMGSAQMTKTVSRSAPMRIGPAWEVLVESRPGVVAATRAKASGSFVGGRFEETATATCSLSDIGPCD